LSVAISSDDQFVVSGSGDKTIRVWSLTSGLAIQVLRGHDGQVLSINLSRDDKYLVSGSGNPSPLVYCEDYSVRVWDLSTGEQTKLLRGHTSNVWSVNLI